MRDSTSDKRIREIEARCNAATKVVAWYPHGYDGTVRGPFGRWFKCTGGDNGMGDPIKYPTPVASIEDDVAYAACAMNELPWLLQLIRTQETALTRALETLERVLADDESQPGGWGPDETMKGILRQSLAEIAKLRGER